MSDNNPFNHPWYGANRLDAMKARNRAYLIEHAYYLSVLERDMHEEPSPRHRGDPGKP